MKSIRWSRGYTGMPRVTEIEVYEYTEHYILGIKARAGVEGIPKLIAETYPKLFAYLKNLGEKAAEAPFLSYHNKDMNDLDITVAVPVSKELPPSDGMFPLKIPTIKMVTCIYRGPYSGTGQTYKELHEWISKNKYTSIGIVRECYLNDPADFSEEELLTKITMPVV